jgi:alternate signal-mediated exported protein
VDGGRPAQHSTVGNAAAAAVVHRWKWRLVIAAVVLAAGLAVVQLGSAWAMWQDSTPASGGVITNGDLDVTGAAGTWRVVDAQGNVLATETAGSTSAPDVGDLKNLESVYGQGLVLELVHSYDLTLKGDNLRAEVAVTFPNNAPTGTYSVKNQAGTDVVASTAIGTATPGQIPVGSTKLQLTVRYQLDEPNLFAAKTVKYGLFSMEVKQV